jgi:SAM-dependent methyltransferase
VTVTPTQWGEDPAFFGPRHAAREAMMLSVLVPHLAPKSDLLDAGAGAGHLANRLAADGHEVVGIDQSERFVAYANAHAAGGARFQVGDITRLEFPAASFDAVVAGEVLEHVDDDARAIAELHRVLRPGGWCLVSVPADPRLWDVSDEWAGHVRRYTESELRSRFAAQGFRVQRLFRWGFPLVRLYHRFAYVPMLRRKIAGGDGPSKPLARWKRALARVLELMFRGDRLFDGSPWGIGYVLLAQKAPESSP